jgi:hypothetical protein
MIRVPLQHPDAKPAPIDAVPRDRPVLVELRADRDEAQCSSAALDLPAAGSPISIAAAVES